MTENAQPELDSEDYVAVVPLIDLLASLADDSLNLGHEARLLRLSKASTESMVKLVQDDMNWLCESGFEPWERVQDAEWALAMPLFSAAKHLGPHREEVDDGGSSEEYFADFSADLRDAYVSTFVTALRLAKPASVWTWLRFKGRLVGDRIHPDSLSILRDSVRDPYRPAGLEIPPDPSTSPDVMDHPLEYIIVPDDKGVLYELWGALVELRQLDKWTDTVCSESFFAELDKRAMKAASCGGSAPEKHTIWRSRIRSQFDEQHESRMDDGSRIARAIDLFERGLTFPGPVALVMMCIVLESLYTTDRSQIGYQIQTRLAKMLGNSYEDRCNYLDRAKHVYDVRSRFVHGDKGISEVQHQDLVAAISLARESLRRILTERELFACYRPENKEKLAALFKKIDLGEAL